MNPLPDSERLLNDLLADESPAGFREALLGETLRLAHRRRRWRQTRRGGGALAMVAVVVVLAWQTLTFAPRRPAQSYQLVRSRPFSPERIVITQPVPTVQFVASLPAANIVRTTESSGRYREIGDDELLALAAPRPAALVRRGPHEAELVFIEPVDEETSRNN